MTDLATRQKGDDAPMVASKVPKAKNVQITPPAEGDSVVGCSVTINRARAELFAYWRDFGNLPLFIENVERVDVLSSRDSHWVVRAPANKTVEWDSVITTERPDELIAWRSAEGADVPNSGRVEFKDVAGRGTVVTVTIAYDPPAGAMGKLIAKLFQKEPAIQARRDLRRFKQLMETGEISTAARTRAELLKERE